MKRIFVPTRSGSDWQPLLAKPTLHWRRGFSAMTAAAAWEDAANELPPEIAKCLDSTGDPLLVGQRLVMAMPEWEVNLVGGTTTSNTDVMAVCSNDAGLCVIGVEAKVLEDFGPLVSEKRANASAGQAERLTYLHSLLDVASFDDAIRYQLLHRTASALLTARQFHAQSAVMLVHAFGCPTERRDDFESFRRAMGAVECAPLVYKVSRFDLPALYVAWCDGDPKYRTVELPPAR